MRSLLIQSLIKKIPVVLITVPFTLILGCGSNSSSSSDVSEDSDEAIQAGVSALSGAANSGNDEATSFAFVNRSVYEKILLGMSVEAAITTCGVPARQDECAAGVKEATYTDCAVGRQKYSGSVQLDFSDNTCAFENSDTITRTMNLTRTGFFGATVTTSSDSHEDYRGNTYGGGSRMTKTSASSLELEVLGIRKVRSRASGKAGYDVQTRTTSPLVINGTWNGNRTIESGTLEVAHNRAEYVASFTFDNLQFNKSECCYPTSGTSSVTYSGSVTGSASLEFVSCGSVKITRTGETKSITLAGCE